VERPRERRKGTVRVPHTKAGRFPVASVNRRKWASAIRARDACETHTYAKRNKEGPSEYLRVGLSKIKNPAVARVLSSLDTVFRERLVFATSSDEVHSRCSESKHSIRLVARYTV
jgi:hypothetical protein